MQDIVRGAMGLSAVLGLMLSGCNRASIQLPADRQESAALCYSAKTVQYWKESGTDALTPDQLNQAVHFLLLDISRSGAAEPGKLENLVARGRAHASKLQAEGNAASYAEPCAEAFPETRPQAFKGLPADSQDTRIACLVLSTALLQMYAASKMAPDPRAAKYVAFSGRMDQRLTQEMQTEPEPTQAQFTERTMRALAQVLRMGPLTQTMDACMDRYAAS